MVGLGEGLLKEFASALGLELLSLVPKFIVAIIVIIVAFLILRFVGGAIKKLLSLANIDKLIERYLRVKLPISLNTIILAIFYIGVILAVLYALISIFFGEVYIELANSLLLYGARVISVIVLAIILFAAFSSIIEKIRVESRMKGYLFFVVMLLLTAMLIDVTALSDPVKQSLYAGLSMGIGASLAVFSVWFFFHEYLDKITAKREKKKREKQQV